MNCNTVRDQLSAYMDGELTDETAAQVQQHLAGCESCSHELALFEQLCMLVHAHVEPSTQPPAWELISQKLNDSALAAGIASTDLWNRGLAPVRSRNWKTLTGAIVALAATILLVANVMIPKREDQQSMNQASMAAVNLQPVLERFQGDAFSAINALKSQFTFQDIALADADADFGRPTYVSTAAQTHTLPGDATVASTKTFSFAFCKCPKGQCLCGPGGCQCVACVCERPDGSTYLVLEHCKSQTVSFGDLPIQLVKRGGRDVQQVTIDGTETISFDRTSGKITVVGLRGESEIETLLASM